MGRAISVFCCFIVGLQFLIGVPVAVCLLFFAIYGGLGPIAIEVHPSSGTSPQMFFHGPTVPPPPSALNIAPPPNIIPPTPAVATNHAILETRAQLGSPLSGTILGENTSPAEEEELLVAAYQKVEAEAALRMPSVPPSSELPTAASSCPAAASNSTNLPDLHKQADNMVIQHLYEMADVDERAGNYQRADQWRALAREIRPPAKPSDQANPSADEAPTAPPSPFDLP